jgi:membrane protein implicated in regulation of membrane protease activity
VKATARPVITTVSGGVANPVVSLAEDAVSATVTVTAILWPLVGVMLLPLALALIILWRRRRRPPRAQGT